MDDLLYIHHLGLLHKGGNAAAARLAVERQLSAADMHPSNMPPSAVLVIRKMHDPLPGKLAKSLGNGCVDREWEQRARAQMTTFCQQAARPAQNPVPPDAQSVLFTDEGELLACLALDIRRGLTQEHWWWRSVLRTVSKQKEGVSRDEASAVLANRMVRNPQAAVAAVAWLANRGSAREALPALSSGRAEQVLTAIASTYQLTEVEFRPGQPPGPRSSLAAVAAPPWEMAHVPPGLGRERTALLGLSIDLQARPEIVRTMSYQRRLSSWFHATLHQDDASCESGVRQTDAAPVLAIRQEDAPLTAAPRTPSRPEMLQGRSTAVGREINQERTTAPDMAASRGETSCTQEAEPAALLQIPWRSPHQKQAGQAGADKHAQEKDSPMQEMEATDPVPAAASPVPRFPNKLVEESVSREVPVPSRTSMPDQAVVAAQGQPGPAAEQCLLSGQPTGLGGVLYLINMMAVLDLPDCFEAGWLLASKVGAWGVLDALARLLLEDAFHGLRNDPLWSMLAQLDGRPPDEPPGFRLPWSCPRNEPPFELPQNWLEGLPELALTPLAENRLHRIHSDCPPLLAGWLIRVLPFIIARLRLALHISPQACFSHTLLAVPGRIYLTSSNLDLVASVDSISLAARMAGLDCDPGWRPEFGRFVRFHFA